MTMPTLGKARKADGRGTEAENGFEWGTYAIVGLGSAVVLFLGILTYLVEGPIRAGLSIPELLAHVGYLFLIETGIAGLVALVIIMTIERFTRSRHQQAAEHLIDRIKNNLFYAIYGRHIPPELFDEVERCLLFGDVIRRGYQVIYAFTRIGSEEISEGMISEEDANNHLFCTLTSSYVLHNITEGPITAPIELLLEAPIDSNLRKFVEVTELKIDNDVVTPSTKVDNPVNIGIRHGVSISTRGSVRVVLKARTIKRKTDMEVWASRVPSDGMKLQVLAPPSVIVQANANHSSDLEHQELNAQIQSWELNRGIFPHQSIIFWWKEA